MDIVQKYNSFKNTSVSKDYAVSILRWVEETGISDFATDDCTSYRTDLLVVPFDIGMMDRIITLVDMDCFYCQVEARLNPTLKGKPLAVVQYNKWKGGGIIAVNYEARNFGVTRSMRGDEARKKCPNIALVHVPEVRGKADLTKYRDAGHEVVNVFCQFSNCVQRASVDEAYIDVTEAVEQRISSLHQVQPSHLPTTFVVGFTDNDSNVEDARQQGLTSWLESIYELQDLAQQRLAVAGVILEEMRTAVFQQTGFHCSAGISHNKILGKLACGLHKPNRQTILPQAGVMNLYKTLPIRKVRNLGGKFGCVVVEQLGCKVMADLLHFTESQLQQQFDEKMGSWLYNIVRGIDNDPVTQRLVSKSIGCCKKFPGRQALATRTDVQFWLSELSAEIAERLAKDLKENKRRAKLLTVSYHQDVNSHSTSSSRSGPLTSYDPQGILADAFKLVKKSNTGSGGGPDSWYPPLKFLGLSVGKFVDEDVVQNSRIHNFFKAAWKGLNKESSVNVTNLNKIVDENISGTNNQNIMNLQKHGDTEPSAYTSNRCDANNTRVMVNETSKTSSTSNSFFMKYLKEHDIAKSAETNSDRNLVDRPESRLPNTDVPICKHTFDTDSDDNIFESPVTSTEEQKEEKSYLLSRTVTTRLNLEASTSAIENHTDDKSTEMWVSLGELFPDVSKVDDDVVALLPVPLQERLQARIEEAKQDSRISSKHALTNMTSSDDSNLTDTPDSWFVGGRTQAETEQGSESVNANLHAAECVAESEMENQPCNESKSSKPMNPTHHSDDQKDNLLCESRYVLQDTIKESLGIVECDNVIFPPAAKQQYLSARYVPPSHREEALRMSADSVNHCKADTSYAHDITSLAPSTSKESGAKCSQNIVAETCPQCRKDVLLSEYLEHLDFHAAEKLHEVLNGVAVHMRTAPNASALHKKPSLELPTKRKRGNRPTKKSSVIDRDKKMRSITTFFTPK